MLVVGRATWSRLSFVGATVTSCVIAALGCSATSTSGGEPRFDAAPPSPPSPPSPAVVLDSSTDANVDVDAGTTWVDLHRDFFGPTGRASCAGDGACHGAANQPGAKATGYVCAGGRDECYAGIVNERTKLVIPGDTTTPANKSFLHLVLRKSDGTGLMPKRPPEFVFTVGDMARIDAWIQRGAPNDSP